MYISKEKNICNVDLLLSKKTCFNIGNMPKLMRYFN